jgi:hypothetical protein
MDKFTEKIFADMEDRKAHPEDWEYTTVCGECGRREVTPIPKAEVLKFRERGGLEAGTPVVLPVICGRCAGPDQDEE